MGSLILLPACRGDRLFVVDFPFSPGLDPPARGGRLFVVDFPFSHGFLDPPAGLQGWPTLCCGLSVFPGIGSSCQGWKTLCCGLSVFPGIRSSCQGWKTLCCWLSVFPWVPWSSCRLAGVTDSLLRTFRFPRDWILLPGVEDSLLLTFCFPWGSCILPKASEGWPTLCCWLSVSRSWSPCLLCWCAAVTEFVVWGSRLRHLARLTRVAESDSAHVGGRAWQTGIEGCTSSIDFYTAFSSRAIVALAKATFAKCGAQNHTAVLKSGTLWLRAFSLQSQIDPVLQPIKVVHVPSCKILRINLETCHQRVRPLARMHREGFRWFVDRHDLLFAMYNFCKAEDAQRLQQENSNLRPSGFKCHCSMP